MVPNGWACVPLGERIDLAYGRGLREEDRQPGDVDVFGSNGIIGSHTHALVNDPRTSRRPQRNHRCGSLFEASVLAN